MEAMFPTKRANSWRGYVDLVEDLTGGVGKAWVFRGQREFDWPLSTSLERTARGDLAKAENYLRYEFDRRAHLFVPPQMMPQGDVETLSLMQHHGAPTRLLDFTYSPYVAAFFALEEAAQNGQSSAVWAIDLDWLANATTQTYLRAFFAESPFPVNENEIKTLVFLAGRHEKPFETLGTLPDSKRSIPAVIEVIPPRDTQRLALQQGTFLAPLDLESTFEENLTAKGAADIGDGVLKIEIPNELRTIALAKLRQSMNVSRMTLFPGLDGFVQSLRDVVLEPSPEQRERLVVEHALMGLRAASRPEHSPQ